MSRAVSATTRSSLYAQSTGDVYVILLEISHATLGTPIRVNNSGSDIVSNGISFVAFPFEITLPNDDDGQISARLSIDNTDRQIVAAVRQMSSYAAVNIKIIRADAPDTVEAEFPDFRLSNVNYDAATVSGDLTIEDFTQEPFPAETFSPAKFPGL